MSTVEAHNHSHCRLLLSHLPQHTLHSPAGFHLSYCTIQPDASPLCNLFVLFFKWQISFACLTLSCFTFAFRRVAIQFNYQNLSQKMHTLFKLQFVLSCHLNLDHSGILFPSHFLHRGPYVPHAPPISAPEQYPVISKNQAAHLHALPSSHPFIFPQGAKYSSPAAPCSRTPFTWLTKFHSHTKQQSIPPVFCLAFSNEFLLVSPVKVSERAAF
jgi:hypothetical protein